MDLTNIPYYFDQTEYVIYGAGSYIFDVLAAQWMLQHQPAAKEEWPLDCWYILTFAADAPSEATASQWLSSKTTIWRPRPSLSYRMILQYQHRKPRHRLLRAGRQRGSGERPARADRE